MFCRVLVLSIPLWVGGSQVREAEKGIALQEWGGVLPTGTRWECAEEMAGGQESPAFQPGRGGGRPRPRRGRRGGRGSPPLSPGHPTRAGGEPAGKTLLGPAPGWDATSLLPPDLGSRFR